MTIRPLLIVAAVAAPLALGACESMSGMPSDKTASASTVSKDSSTAPGTITQTTQNSGGVATQPGPKNPS